jgi:4'-phosphopantetheinyl transferase
LIKTFAEVPAGHSWLSAREQAVVGNMYFEKRRRDWKLGRWTAKCVTLSYLGLGSDPSQFSGLEIVAAPDGAPEAFLRGQPAPVSLSISHSSDTAFCVAASAGIALGCDLEQIQARDPNFAADYFTEEELRFLERMPATDRPLFTNLIWSAKESALKALRQGLRRDTRSIKVRLAAERHEGWNPLSAVDLETARAFHGWWQVLENQVQTIVADPATGPPTKAL